MLSYGVIAPDVPVVIVDMCWLEMLQGYRLVDRRCCKATGFFSARGRVTVFLAGGAEAKARCFGWRC